MADGFTRTTEGRIASAWAALAGARSAASHSPNSDTCAIEEMCENTVNDLLDNLWRNMSPAQQAAADARAMHR